MKSGELAARLGMSDSVIRKWSGQYAAHLSAGAGRPQPGQEREFNERDQLVMATISQLRLEGRSHAEIEREIASGWHIEHLPPLPDPEVQEARSKISLVPVDRLQRAIDRIDALENEVERVIQERDRAIAVHEEDQERMATLREELARSKAFLEAHEKEMNGLRESLQKAEQAGMEVSALKQRLGQLEGENYRLGELVAYTQWLLEEEKKRKKGWFG